MNKFICRMVIQIFFVFMITLSSNAADYTLGIFGNANMDNTIDEKDVEYVQSIIDGKGDRTELADANNDSKIDEGDITQIESIIAGNEKTLTFKDDLNNSVTIKKPIERIALLHRLAGCQVMQLLNLEDKVVCVPQYVSDNKEIFSKLSQVRSYGDLWSPDWEVITDSTPDTVFTYVYVDKGVYKESVIKDQTAKVAGTQIVALCVMYCDRLPENMMKLGYIFNRKAEAQKFIDWYDGVNNMFKSKTQGLSADQKTLFWFSHGLQGVTLRPWDDLVGGKNIGTMEAQYDTEWIVEQDPKVIMVESSPQSGGYGYTTDDSSGYKAVLDEVKSRPGFSGISAVKEGRTYVLDMDSNLGGPAEFVEIAYIAKMLHPDLFKDMDPRTIHQEYLKLLGVDFNVFEHGIFAYPLPE